MRKGIKICIVVSTVCLCFFSVKAESKAAVKLDPEHFSQQLLSWFTWRDTNEDGYLSDSELKKITEIYTEADESSEEDNLEEDEENQADKTNVSDAEVEVNKDEDVVDLKGIQYCKYLKVFEASCLKIKNFKCLEKVTNLETIKLTSCELECNELDFSKMSKLKEIECMFFKVDNLKFGETNSVKKLIIELTGNKKLDLSKLKKLEYLALDDIGRSELPSFKNNKNLEYIRLGGRKKAKSLDLRYNNKLNTVETNVYVKKMQISKNNTIEELSISKGINKLDFSRLKKIKSIYLIEYNRKVDVSKCKNLNSLNIKGNFKKLYLNQCTKLNTLIIEAPLTDINLQKCSKLKMLIVEAPLKKLDLQKCTKLKTLIIEAPLTDINMGECADIEYLTINAPIEKLELEAYKKLRRVELLGIEGNTFYLSNNDNLKEVLFKKCNVKNIYVSDMSKMKNMSVSENDYLESVSLNNCNNIRYLNVHKCAAMKSLHVTPEIKISKLTCEDSNGILEKKEFDSDAMSEKVQNATEYYFTDKTYDYYKFVID